VLQASTEANREAIFEAMNSPKSKSYVKVEWDDRDNGCWRPLEDLDVQAVTEWGDEVEKKNFTSFSLTPVASDASFQVLNVAGRYSENSGSDYAGILIPNRKIRISAGYWVPDEVVEEYEFPLGLGVIKNGLKLEDGKLKLDIANTDDDPGLYMRDYWATNYGDAFYDAADYSAVGYWIGTYDAQSIGEFVTFRSVSVAANNTRAKVFYRTFVEREAYEAAHTTSASWTLLGNTIDGYQTWTISVSGQRYIQIAVVPTGTTWSSGDEITEIALGIGSHVEFVYRAVFYLDTPGFPEPPAPECPRVMCSARDGWKKALEITCQLPDVNTLTLDAVIKSVCDQVGMVYTAASIADLSGLGARALSTGIEKPQKIDAVMDWLVQIGTQRHPTAGALRYRSYLKYDEALRDQVLYIQPRALSYEAVFVFQSRYYSQLGDRGRNYDKKLYRITVLSKQENLAAETLLTSASYGSPGIYTLSWSGARFNKRIRASGITGIPVFNIILVTSTTIQVQISGDFTGVNLAVYGCAWSTTAPAAAGEWLRVETDGGVAGQAVVVVNPLVVDDAEAERIARGFGDEYGEPGARATGLDWPYLHVTPETNEMAALWARFNFDDNLYRILGRRYSWNYLGGTTRFDLEDTGLNWSDITDFKYDDWNRIKKYDIGLLYDMEDGPQALNDTASYEWMRAVPFVGYPPPPPPTPTPLLWNKMEADIGGGVVHSEIGGDFTVLGAPTFPDSGMTTGPFNHYLNWAAAGDGAYIPGGYLLPDEGCLEFWLYRKTACTGNYNRILAWNGGVAMLMLSAKPTLSDDWLYLSTNVSGSLANVFGVGDIFGTAELLLPIEEWFHFALSWRKQPNPSMPDDVWMFVNGVYVKAQRHPSYSGVPKIAWSAGWGIQLLVDQYGGSWDFPGCVDNVKGWNYAKSNFSDRFVEGV
jgi:hypothetical protein